MNKTRLGNFFEDFEMGMRMRHPTPRTITDADQRLYIGLTSSRDPMASATTVAKACGFADSMAESFLVFNIAFGKTVPDVSLNAIANLGYAELNFHAPVFFGDTIEVESEVIGMRENSNGKSGVVYTRSVASNQHGLTVLTWVRWVMVHKRNPTGHTLSNAILPALKSSIGSQELTVNHFMPAVARIAEFTGSKDFWEDYEVGERVDHFSAMTINDSDHSIATRLYQNTAKAHFDGHQMASSAQGKRLVYGGHVISLCRALSYDGLENSLSVLAVNGGTHVAPTFAGDTLVCTTTVLAKLETGNATVGALRLRLIGAKNIGNPAAIEIPPPAGTGERQAYAPSIVLDLDYTIAIPKQPH